MFSDKYWKFGGNLEEGAVPIAGVPPKARLALPAVRHSDYLISVETGWSPLAHVIGQHCCFESCGDALLSTDLVIMMRRWLRHPNVYTHR